MLKIELNEIKISVPESWNEIYLGDYENYYNDKPTTARGRVDYIAKIVKVDPAVLLAAPSDVFNIIVDTLGFMFKEYNVPPTPAIEAGGVQYLVKLEDKLSLGAWIDAEETQKQESGVLSGVLAIVCRPDGEAYDYINNEARQKMFAALPVSKVLGVTAFFLHYKNAFDRRTRLYMELQKIVDLLPRSIKLSRGHGAGISVFQIWQTIRYWILIRSLRWQFRRRSRLYNIKAIKT
jgi:hypothetical protein